MMITNNYEELWKTTWGDMQHYGPVHRHNAMNVRRVVRSLPEIRTILDVGCGGGDNLAVLAAMNMSYSLQGADVSAEAISIARAKVPAARFIPLDINRQELDARFDLVMCHQVLEHIPDDVSVMKRLRRMSSRYVYVSSMQGRMRRSEIAIGHVRNYTRLELAEKLETAGLRVQWVRGWGFPFYSPLYRTVIEWLPGGPPQGPMGWKSRLMSSVLFWLYCFNWPGRGDIISALAEVADDEVCRKAGGK